MCVCVFLFWKIRVVYDKKKMRFVWVSVRRSAVGHKSGVSKLKISFTAVIKILTASHTRNQHSKHFFFRVHI